MYIAGLMVDKHETAMDIDRLERQIAELKQRIFAPEELRILEDEYDLECRQFDRYGRRLRELIP